MISPETREILCSRMAGLAEHIPGARGRLAEFGFQVALERERTVRALALSSVELDEYDRYQLESNKEYLGCIAFPGAPRVAGDGYVSEFLRQLRHDRQEEKSYELNPLLNRLRELRAGKGESGLVGFANGLPERLKSAKREETERCRARRFQDRSTLSSLELGVNEDVGLFANAESRKEWFVRILGEYFPGAVISNRIDARQNIPFLCLSVNDDWNLVFMLNAGEKFLYGPGIGTLNVWMAFLRGSVDRTKKRLNNDDFHRVRIHELLEAAFYGSCTSISEVELSVSLLARIYSLFEVRLSQVVEGL